MAAQQETEPFPHGMPAHNTEKDSAFVDTAKDVEKDAASEDVAPKPEVRAITGFKVCESSAKWSDGDS